MSKQQSNQNAYSGGGSEQVSTGSLKLGRQSDETSDNVRRQELRIGDISHSNDMGVKKKMMVNTAALDDSRKGMTASTMTFTKSRATASKLTSSPENANAYSK